jgi:hypothetical protein
METVVINAKRAGVCVAIISWLLFALQLRITSHESFLEDGIVNPLLG